MFTQSFHHPSKTLADRLFTAEFDDALVDQIWWKNVRYEGCKVKSQKINAFSQKETVSNSETGIGFASIVTVGATLGEMVIGGTGQSVFTVGGYFASLPEAPSDISNAPGIFCVSDFKPKITWEGDTINPIGTANVKNETIALYIANTVIGGQEDPQYADIKNHSYVSINQILLINPNTNETQVLDREAEDFIPFHTFITNDLPTGASFSIKLIDESIANSLKGSNQYKVKMNKGFLLKTFDFKHAPSLPQNPDNNSMYLYKKGTVRSNLYEDGIYDAANPPVSIENNDRLRFRFGTVEILAGSLAGFSGGHLQRGSFGPSFGSSSIIENKYTQNYYSGSYGFINEPDFATISGKNTDLMAKSGLGSASKFIGQDTLEFLARHNASASLEQEKTELHITFFEGTTDFAPGFNDERSISTFEVDSNQNQLDVGGICQDFLPKTHEITFKGVNDDRFDIKINHIADNFINAYNTGSDSLAGECIGINQYLPLTAGTFLQKGINADLTESASVYVQGGALGQVGFKGVESSSGLMGAENPLYGISLSGSMNSDNFYSGSFSYQLSFLNKDHVVITNIDKNTELYNGIGNKGIVIIPEFVHPRIKNNVSFYLQQAGIIDSSPNTLTFLADDTK